MSEHGQGDVPIPAGIAADLALVKREVGNLAAAALAQMTKAVKRSLKQIQYRPGRSRRLPRRRGPCHRRQTNAGNGQPARGPTIAAHPAERLCRRIE